MGALFASDSTNTVWRVSEANLYCGASHLFDSNEEGSVIASPIANPENLLPVSCTVNLHRSSIELLEEEGFTFLQFTFESSEPCTVKVTLSTRDSHIKVPAISFPSSTVKQTCKIPVDLSRTPAAKSLPISQDNEEQELFEFPRAKDIIPDGDSDTEYSDALNLVISLRGGIKGAGAGSYEETNEDLEVHTQKTSCEVKRIREKNDTEMNSRACPFSIHVVDQTIELQGNVYAVFDLYGLECVNKSTEYCVVCMSEPKTTLCIPCRHYCVCRSCAQVLKFQSNKCPICRASVRSMLSLQIEEETDTKIECDSVKNGDE